MLKLRAEQIRVLNEHAEKQFEARALEHVNRVFPAELQQLCAGGSDQPARRRIRLGVRKAAFYRVVQERDVLLFIDLMFGIGPDFDQQAESAWITEILEHDTLSGHEKIQRIYRRLAAGSGG
jgi:hypothetical protein